MKQQQMQNALQTLQFQYRIYNNEIEPEHDTEYYCTCPIHQYKYMKRNRSYVLRMWCDAVMYPGEKFYSDLTMNQGTIFNSNPYTARVVSPYGYGYGFSNWNSMRPNPGYHAQSIHQTIQLNNAFNHEAQAKIDAQEPKINIWDDKALENAMARLNVSENPTATNGSEKPSEKHSDEKRKSVVLDGSTAGKTSKMSGFRKAFGIKSSDERAMAKTGKAIDKGRALRDGILAEEAGRWQDESTRQIVAAYQEKVGMARKIEHLRTHQPIQYSHLLRAGYFEPIPVAWANLNSNPLKFSIEAAGGWRGITPAWRGYEDTAEERLYWVLNHREGPAGIRMKPDFISEMTMARDRMAKAVEPPPEYFSANDTCHLQHTSAGYSKQVMPAPFRAYDRPEVPTDDTMLLLDVSGSMDFDPVRPMYVLHRTLYYSRLYLLVTINTSSQAIHLRPSQRTKVC